MSNTTPTDAARPRMTAAAGALGLMLIACSPATGSGEGGATPVAAATATPGATTSGAAAAPARPAPAPAASPAAAGSRVLGKKDIALRGKPACDVRFVYAGRPPEDLFWEEPCKAVTAKMATRQELSALGRWARLEEADRRFVAAQGGRVLYVEGGFSASVYPVGTTGSTYEVPVAD